jgi:uncharacterized membrane-anchored protein YjiN (DUF445 family)
VGNKVRKTIFCLSKVKHTLPLKINILLVKGLIMPHLEYCINIYGNATGLSHLIKLQKWAIRNATNSKYNAHTEPLLKKHNIYKLPDLYTAKCLTLIRKKIEGIGPEILDEMMTYHELKNRKPHVLTTTKPINKLIDSLPPHTYPKIWNDFGLNEIKETINSFKNMIKKLITTDYESDCSIPKCYICKQIQ